MNGRLRVAVAQGNFRVGDFPGNEAKLMSYMRAAESEGADVLLTPEMAVCGYPAEDLLLEPGFLEACAASLARLAAASGKTTVILGCVAPHQGASGRDAVARGSVNAAAILRRGKILGVYGKRLLPNYGVFDEGRYFEPGGDAGMTWEVAGTRVGACVCEDVWAAGGPAAEQVSNGARAIFVANASPFHAGKPAARERLLAANAERLGVPFVYANLIGGQDELVFDGGSVAVDKGGVVAWRAPSFVEDFSVIDVPLDGNAAAASPPLASEDQGIYQALVLGLGDYCRKNGFSRITLGMSGGIDSALSAAIAVDALGASSVTGVAMPGPFSSEGSLSDAKASAGLLGIRLEVVPIVKAYEALTAGLAGAFNELPFSVAEENLQARIRGTVLMALSNKLGGIVLSTGNKSEVSVGYATLYGDMCGGFSVLKDVYKTQVYRLAQWRNRAGVVIPEGSLTKAPSAELAPGQEDADSLPPYPVLDAILEMHVERGLDARHIAEKGYDGELAARVINMVVANEYKRRQSAPGVKVTPRSFGRDRRLPITNAYRPPSPGQR